MEDGNDKERGEGEKLRREDKGWRMESQWSMMGGGRTENRERSQRT
jgi:hypothetical protein